MAIIKCPECKEAVSDNAESCPHCGVRIAGNIEKCPNCNEHVLKGSTKCNFCDKPLTSPAPSAPLPSDSDEDEAPKSNRKKYIWITVAVLLILAIGGGYGYTRYAANEAEEQMWEELISNPAAGEPDYQAFIDEYPESKHRAEAEKKLEQIKADYAEWHDVYTRCSLRELRAYIDQHPNSAFLNAAKNVIDSLAWQEAINANTDEGYQKYLDENPDGKYTAEASDKLNQIDKNKITPNEQSTIKTLFTNYFNSLANADEDGVCSTISSVMDSFLGKSAATKTDVMNYMKKIHAADISSMKYTINNDYKIVKNDEGADEYSYNVTFTVDLKIEREDATKENFVNYRINAKVASDGMISELAMHKITSRTGE